MLKEVNDKLLGIQECATFKDLINKFTYQVLKSRDVCRQECCYNNAGGDYTYHTVGTVRLSLRSVSLDEVIAEINGEEKKNTFKAHYKTYKSLPEGTKMHVNFYLHVAAKDDKAPVIMGFPSHCSWPLTEEYAQAHLLIFMPHQAVSPETELKRVHPSFVTSLLEFMYNPLYPPQF
jgi:hypothetical protein